MLLPWPERQQQGDYNPPPPRLRNELRMIALSAVIRAKPVRSVLLVIGLVDT